MAALTQHYRLVVTPIDHFWQLEVLLFKNYLPCFNCHLVADIHFFIFFYLCLFFQYCILYGVFVMFCCVKIKESFFRGTVSYQFFFEINQIILKNLNSKLNQKNQGFNPNRKEIKFQQKINFFKSI